jgi:hypothetical protein
MALHHDINTKPEGQSQSNERMDLDGIGDVDMDRETIRSESPVFDTMDTRQDDETDFFGTVFDTLDTAFKEWDQRANKSG